MICQYTSKCLCNGMNIFFRVAAIILALLLYSAPVFAQSSPTNCAPQQGEFPECPEVDCRKNPQFVERVKKYFNYTPPANNREAYENPDYLGYKVNLSSEADQNNATAGQAAPYFNCHALKNDARYSEACQDNRYRDLCLMGEIPNDPDSALGRQVSPLDLPWDGVVGAKPYQDLSNTSKLNCVVPKNTERKSTLELDFGWRFRHMCPGNRKLARVRNDKISRALHLFTGVFNCWAPLPKCDLDTDWVIGENDWMGEEKGKYKNLQKKQTLLTRALNSQPVQQTLEGLFSSLPPNVAQALKQLLEPKRSRRPECKPAFYVRLMMDSCANQYILKTNMIPNYTFNPDSQRPGISPQYCQPLRTVNLQNSEEEYKPYDYMKRAVEGLLEDDYMPWVSTHRKLSGAWEPLSGTFNTLTNVGRELKGMELDRINKITKKYDKLNPSINNFANRNVETILDPSHPFSPRFDIAESIDGTLLTDRLIFVDEKPNEAPWDGRTETPAPRYDPLIQACHLKKSERRGYFEYGECTVYCSAVDVDLLRFRYEDFKTCMGCNIHANEKAFWKEVEINEEHYIKKRCREEEGCEGTKTGYNYNKVKFTNPLTGNEFPLCGAVKKKEEKGVSCNAACLTICTASAGSACISCYQNNNDCLDWIFLGGGPAFIVNAFTSLFGVKLPFVANLCKKKAYAEAMGRARSNNIVQLNEKKEPTYGPSAMKSLNPTALIPGNIGNLTGGALPGSLKMWPVCATRFDEINPVKDALCIKAKAAAGACTSQIWQLTDPNIGNPAVLGAMECAVKTAKQICQDAAKPVAGINFLKIRTRKSKVESADPNWDLASITKGKEDGDPAASYDFRGHFGNHRPYMRWWDTGGEAFQPQGADPEYSCDWGSNDTIIGVGRDYNSIHGRKAKLCRFGGGALIGGNCFKIEEWVEGVDVTPGGISGNLGNISGMVNQLSGLLGNLGVNLPGENITKALEKLGASTIKRSYPNLAGSEWAELKMYQANCFRYSGLNCLCQYEKVFKHMAGEDAVLQAKGGILKVKRQLSQTNPNASTPAKQSLRDTVEITYNQPWLGYASEPLYRNSDDESWDAETALTSTSLPPNQQFPNLHYPAEQQTYSVEGLDYAQNGDIVVWPSNEGTLPRVGIVTGASNAYTTAPEEASLGQMLGTVPGQNHWVMVIGHNDGKFPDACGNTTWLGYGAPRVIFSSVDAMKNHVGLEEKYASRVTKLLEDQLVATYYCDDPDTFACVDRNWGRVKIFRPEKAASDPRLK